MSDQAETDPFDDPLGELDGMDEVMPEDWPTFFTPVPVWVLLCGCSAQAYRAYAFLAEHINNRTPGKRIAFPTQKAIALVLGLKDRRDVAKYTRELEAVGAVRIEKFDYAGGMRHRYRYYVRFNPPEGFTGLRSLQELYQANPQVKAAPVTPMRKAALDTPTESTPEREETAGQREGGKKPTLQGGKKPTLQGGEIPTAQLDQEELHPSEPETAPSARSAGTPEAQPQVVGGRARGGSAASGKKKSATRLSAVERKLVNEVVAFFPAALEVPAFTPPNLSQAILRALSIGNQDERTVDQIGDRIRARWIDHGYAQVKPEEIGSGVGVAVSLVRCYKRGDKYACPDPRCEDGVSVDTGESCRACAERIADRTAERRQQMRQQGEEQVPPKADLPAPRPPLARPECSGRDGICGRPVTNDGEMCSMCLDDIEDAAAAAAGGLEYAGAGPAPF